MDSNDLKEGLNKAADAVSNAADAVVSEAKEVAQETQAAVSGQKLNSTEVGAAGYRGDANSEDGKGLAIASLVLGIVAIVFAFIYTWVGVIAGLVGLVLGAMARKKNQTGLATAGFVCSIIGVVLSLAMWICALICVSAVVSSFS